MPLIDSEVGEVLQSDLRNVDLVSLVIDLVNYCSVGFVLATHQHAHNFSEIESADWWSDLSLYL